MNQFDDDTTTVNTNSSCSSLSPTAATRHQHQQQDSDHNVSDGSFAISNDNSLNMLIVQSDNLLLSQYATSRVGKQLDALTALGAATAAALASVAGRRKQRSGSRFVRKRTPRPVSDSVLQNGENIADLTLKVQV